MREIKFRAWHKLQKKIVPWDQLISIEGNSSFNPNYINLGLCFRELEKHADTPLILMQYVGLKDKNDIPIYESDITNRGEIVFSSGSFRYKDGSFICKNDVVIGNIWETPELLKEQND